jgi:hypothetical protein
MNVENGGKSMVAVYRNTYWYNREFLFIDFHGRYVRVAPYQGELRVYRELTQHGFKFPKFQASTAA